MTTVWKTVLKPTDIQIVDLPRGAEIIFCGEQRGNICIWYRCDETAPKEQRKIAICGTGSPCPDAGQGSYIGSVIMHGGALVFHLFEGAM